MTLREVLATHLLDDAVARTRFRREIEHTVAIEHSNVVPVYSAGYEDRSFYLAMRYVHGPDRGGFSIARDLFPRRAR